MAFFQRAVVPRVLPRVTSFRRICMVRTSVTFTSNSFSSASRIWCFDDVGMHLERIGLLQLVDGGTLLRHERLHDHLAQVE